jgi:hypothetical protein
MSDSNRGKRDSRELTIAVSLGLIVLMAAIWAVSWGYSKQAEYYRNADANHAEYTRNTYAPIANSCIILALEAQSDCLSKASNERRQHRRDEQDLASQKTSAIWASLTGSAAFIGMVLSAFGVFLVWRTFSATREANLIAREIGEAQIRAYVSVNNVKFFVEPVVRDGSRALKCRVQVKNTGQSPARDVVFTTRIDVMESAKIKKSEVFIFPDDAPFSRTSLGATESIFADSEIKIDNLMYNAINLGQSFYIVEGCVLYDDVFGKERRKTYFRYHAGYGTGLSNEGLPIFVASPNGNSTT